MPIYEYRCKACGEETEIIQKLSDPPARKCPACGKSRLEKIVSAAGFRLAGGGWYESDFKSSGKKNLAGDSRDTVASKKETPAKPAKAEKKTESKSAAKAAK